MQEVVKYKIINIRDYLGEDKKILGEKLLRLISGFSCTKNEDVEKFLKNNAIEFTKKHQSVTYLVISADNGELLGYFAIAIKPLSVNGEVLSNNEKKRLSRVSVFDEHSQMYTMSAYLIAQFGKNFSCSNESGITVAELLEVAWNMIEDMQYNVGGVVAFLDATNDEKLLSFYRRNKFKQFDTRLTLGNKREPQELVQLLRLI